MNRGARLHEHAAHFRTMLKTAGLVPPGENYIVPLILGSDARTVAAASALQAAGFDVRAPFARRRCRSGRPGCASRFMRIMTRTSFRLWPN